MKITIEIGEDELIHPQMAAAIAAQLESQVNDGVPYVTPSILELVPEPTPEREPIEDSETSEDPNQMKFSEQEEIEEEETFTYTQLREMSLVIARNHESSKPVLDILEKASGVRRLLENDNTHHTAIGKLFVLAIKALT